MKTWILLAALAMGSEARAWGELAQLVENELARAETQLKTYDARTFSIGVAVNLAEGSFLPDVEGGCRYRTVIGRTENLVVIANRATPTLAHKLARLRDEAKLETIIGRIPQPGSRRCDRSGFLVYGASGELLSFVVKK